MQRIDAPVREDLIAQRIAEIKDHGVVAAASLTPQRVRNYYETALDAGLDVLVIQGTVISAEHVSKRSEALNLKEFIREVPVPVLVGGCASYATGLHLMRTGAVGVLVGVGPGAACTTRECSASGCLRPRRLPTLPRPVPSTCSRPVST